MAGIADWLDVFVHPRGGPAAVRAALEAAAPAAELRPVADDAGPAPRGREPATHEPPPDLPADAAWDGRGEPPEHLRLPADHIARAHRYIAANWLSRDGRSSELVAVGGIIHRYERDGGRWVRVDDAALIADIKRWAAPLSRFKPRRVKGELLDGWAPANLTNREAADLLDSLRYELLVDLEGSRNDRGQVQPGRFWLRGTARAEQRYRGSPVPAARAWERLCDDPEAEGLPPATMLLPLADGLLDLEAWDRGRVVRLPHDTRLFNLNRFAYELPWDELLEAQDRAIQQGRDQAEGTDPAEELACTLEAFAQRVATLSRRLAPRFWAFLSQALGEHPPAGQRFRDADDRAKHVTLCCLAYSESVRELAKFGGYLLAAQTHHHFGNLFVLHGQPGTGKGVMFSVYTGVLGATNCLASSLKLMGRMEFQHECIGKAVVTLSDERPVDLDESREGWQLVKKITGEDSVSFRPLYGQPTTNVHLYCRFLMSVNEMPNLDDVAMTRRMVVVDFTRLPDRQDLGLKHALARPDERLGQLLWMLLGRLWLAVDGRFIQPDASRAALEVYEQEADRYGGFVAECLEVTGDQEHAVSGAQIAACYAGWAAEHLGHTKFPSVARVMAGVWPAMRKRWPESQHLVHRNVQPRDGDVRMARVHRGMRITPLAWATYVASRESNAKAWAPDPGPGLGHA